MTTAVPFDTAVRVAVAEARELIADGAADDLTLDDLAQAKLVLDGTDRTPERVEALAQVVALGAEYLVAVGRGDDEPDVANAVASLGRNPVTSVREWYLRMGG